MNLNLTVLPTHSSTGLMYLFQLLMGYLLRNGEKNSVVLKTKKLHFILYIKTGRGRC